MKPNMITRENVQTLYAEQVQLFKVLAHPVRLAILDVLRNGEACVCHLEATLGYRQAYISQQLAMLREAGLIHDRRDGWNIFYQVSDPRLYAVVEVARAMVARDGVPVEVRLEAEDCSCPKCSSERS